MSDSLKIRREIITDFAKKSEFVSILGRGADLDCAWELHSDGVISYSHTRGNVSFFVLRV